ncbi:ScbA/BarX family gamma-butyrolactone biosynthesis protein [Streptomyces sp. TRM76323]|uniref:ScbA/BarX family gamma-butyrolactone biosynthesis protein n=1 Tax=Streptomyces tamarix TaxID=3078565 RepID=A0ABU3QIQ9_9ACTN|nr:ScbA/BarX family gamma-butyrolactone biosynthesis protein [Streptomyces tamarix]MDT9682267.1 ScbA/BarX family gamma-butyrolactone biosynthesis protein [Streptomyces tamarix]
MSAEAVEATLFRDFGPRPTDRLGEYTHLRHSSAILIEDWHRRGPDSFGVLVRWPAGGAAGEYDPRLLAQTIRQSGLLVAHAEYGVPTGHQTLLNTLNITVWPGFRAREGAAFEVRVTVTREAGPSALGMEFEIRRPGGAPVCLANTRFGWVSPAAYRRVRGRHLAVDWGRWPLPEALPPRRVGRTRDNDVLLAAGGDGHRWQLRNDVSQTLLFDHPVDHVPGLVLLEAAQQAAYAATWPWPVDFTDVCVSYAQYVEFDEPCWIEAGPLTTLLPGRFAIEVRGHQGGRTAFEARMRGRRLRKP